MSFMCEHGIVHPEVFDREHEFAVLPQFGYDVKPFYEKTVHKPFTFQSPQGYTIAGEIIPAPADAVFPDGKKRAVIIAHGYRGNRWTALSYGEIYNQLGFDVVVYDHRCHGESGGDFCSLGFYESKDLFALAEHFRALFPPDTVWGIHGESMGAASVMLAVPHLKWLSFCAEDSGYGDMRDPVRSILKRHRIFPVSPIMFVTGLILKVKRGFTFSDVRPFDTVKNIRIPMFFTHGENDILVLPDTVHRLYDAKQEGNKGIVMFEGVSHAKCILKEHVKYGEELERFLRENAII